MKPIRPFFAALLAICSQPVAAASVPAIDTLDPGAVKSGFFTYYATAMPDIAFTGSLATCNPGAVSPTYQDWFLTRLNYLRTLAGVGSGTGLEASMNADLQAVALYVSATGHINTAVPPDPTRQCYSQAAATNMPLSVVAADNIDSLSVMFAWPPNVPILFAPSAATFGFGQVPEGRLGSALRAVPAVPPPAPPDAIAWPRGYVPAQLLQNTRCVFALPGADLSAATVKWAQSGYPLSNVFSVTRTVASDGEDWLSWSCSGGQPSSHAGHVQVLIENIANAPSTSYTYEYYPFDATATLQSDLSVVQTATPAVTEVGKDVVFRIIVSLDGSLHVPSATLTSVVPANAQFVWVTPGCAHLSGTVTCALVPRAAYGVDRGYQMKIELVLRPIAAGTLTSTFSVAGPLPDYDPSANNTHSLDVPVAAGTPGVPVPRYRLYSAAMGEHHYTTDENEYNVLGANPQAWVQEGIAGKVLNNPGTFNGVAAVPYYRLFSQYSFRQWHHWTTDPNEYYTIRMGSPNNGWVAEGVDGYILPTHAVGTTQLYRLLYPGNGAHLWTVDQNEYNTLTSSYGWIGEGGAGFVVPHE